jgi:hypothetical protein
LAAGKTDGGGDPLTGSAKKLSAKKEEAILALLTARSVEEAARSANIPSRTLYRWMKEPDFASAFRQAKSVAFAQAVARVQQGAGAAVSTMMRLMVDATVPPATRLRAAELVYKHAQDGIETEGFDERLSALEQTSEALKEDA